jgi:hypothetical protein
MDNVTAINPDLMPSIDVEREMISFCAEKIREYRESYGVLPTSIAFCLIGEDDGGSYTDAYSWSPADDSKSRLHTCAVAATVLFKRALGL